MVEAEEHQSLIGEIVKNYDLSKQDYQDRHKSSFWDVFDKAFEERVDQTETWELFRRNGMTCGLEVGLLITDKIKYLNQDLYYSKLYNSDDSKEIKKRYHLLKNITGEKFIIDNIGDDVGDPRHIEYNRIKLNFDNLYQLYHFWQISRFLSQMKVEPKKIVEIGAGYGNLASKIKKLYKHSSYIIYDLPEVLAIQTYYLKKHFPNAKFVFLEDFLRNREIINEGLFDFALLPAWYSDSLEDNSVDVFINMRSMMEMNNEIISNYFNIIQRSIKVGGVLYLVNCYSKKIGETTTRFKDYPFDQYWNFVVSHPTWLQTHIHELFALRLDCPAIFPPDFILKAFPYNSPPKAPSLRDNVLTKLTNYIYELDSQYKD